MTITFGSVCSGIEAASVAWHPLGWRAAWLSEIEPYPCSLLAHHYPDVPNLGDMTKIAHLIRDGFIPAPDVFCGGTPCQAFSIAGLRNSLDDARGNLSLIFCEIANEIDARRAAAGFLPATIFWENVPGVLSTKDNAFGCFLAGLAGEDDPIVAPGGKWSNAGCVYGPTRAVAWRVLDAQYFGVAQRRRRVFVVASARDGFDPAAVLFEFDGVRRDSAPRRTAGKDITHDLAPCLTSSGRGVERGGDTRGQDPVVAVLQHVTGTLSVGGKESGSATQQDAHAGLLVPIGFNARQDPDSWYDRTGPLDTDGGTQAVSYAIQAGALRTNPLSGPDGVGVQEHIAHTLEARAEVQAVAFSCKDYGADATVELAPATRAMRHQGSHANAGGQLAVTYPIQNALRGAGQNGLGIGAPTDPMYTLDLGSQHAVCVTGDITHTLKAEGFDASEDGTGRGQLIVASMAFAQNTRDEVRLVGGDGELSGALSAQPGMKQTTYVAPGGMAVRRLTPRECERLQGFPDDYTLIPHRGKPAADGPRYKALGNSWAVPNVRWIGRRIQAELARLEQ